MRRKKNFLTHILTCRIIIKQVLKMSSQYRNKPIQEKEIRKKNSLIKIWNRNLNNIRKFLGGSHSQYPTWIHTEFYGFMPKYHVFRHRVFGKYWNYFRFSHITTVFDVDFHVDFKRKKIPADEPLWRRHTEVVKVPY